MYSKSDMPTNHLKMAYLFPSKYMSTSEEFPIHVHGWLRIRKDGRCERFMEIIPSGTDLLTGVQSKDVVISQKSNIFVRIYIPKTISNRKLPILIYYHGGGFVTESANSSTYHPTLNLITKESNVIIVSVNYRLAPEYLIPIAFEDSWEAIKWVATHGNENGQESWLNNHADFQNVFFGGESSGANIAHNMAIRVGLNPIKVINLKGVIMLHPYFGGKIPTKGEFGEFHRFMEEMWKLANIPGIGLDHPLLNPATNPHVSSIKCSKILVCVAEKDKLKSRGLNYKKMMEQSGWKGKLEMMESKGEGHAFFLANTSCENARILRNKVCTFINHIRSKA